MGRDSNREGGGGRVGLGEMGNKKRRRHGGSEEGREKDALRDESRKKG